MAYTIDLAKKEEKVTICLAKKGVNTAPIMRVAAALDISGSMSGVIGSDQLQSTLDQLLGISVKFDDNGEIDVWKFDDGCDYVGTCAPDDFGSYVEDNNIKPRGGTAYSPVMKDIHEFMFGEGETVTKRVGGFFGLGGKKVQVQVGGNDDDTPVMVLFITDGAPFHDTVSRIHETVRSFGDKPIFWQMIGVGNSDFSVLTGLEKAFENVGFVNLSAFNLSDDEVYEQLISDKLISFIREFEDTGALSASA